MSFNNFLIANWVLFALLGIVIVAILIYELIHAIQAPSVLSNTRMSNLINQGATLIDTRASADFNNGHIATAKNVPADKFANFLQHRKSSKDAVYILCCQRGISAQNHAQMMRKHGFKQVYVLKGGIEGWLSDNLPLVS